MTASNRDRPRADDETVAADAARDAEAGDDRRAADDAERRPRVVRRRDPDEMSAEERSFLSRHRADMPPHHDSAWG